MRNFINVFLQLIFIDCFQIDCLRLFLFSNELISPIREKTYFIGMNDLNSNEFSINEQQYFTLKQIYALQNPNEYTPIQIIQAPSETCQFCMKFCYLYQNNIRQYEIFCRDGFSQYVFNNNLNFTYIKNLTLVLQTEDQDLCEYFFANENDQFQVVCFQNHNIKILTINGNNETTQVNYKNDTIPTINQCKRKVHKILDFTIVIYFQCYEWNIFFIQNQKIIHQINNEALQIYEKVIDVQYCLNLVWNKIKLVLQHSTSFSQIQFYDSEYQIFQLVQEVKGLLYLFFEDCEPIFIIQKEYQQYIHPLNSPTDIKRIVLDISNNPKQFFIYEDSQLFVIYQNKISIYFNQGKNLDFNYSLLFFNRIQLNYFFALDIISNNLLFFQIENTQPLSEINKLAQSFKYVLSIFKIRFFDNELKVGFCAQTSILQDSSELSIYNLENIIKFSGETQNHQLFEINKMELFSSIPINFKIRNTFNSPIYSDKKQIKDFCSYDIELLNFSSRFQIIKLLSGQTLILVSQPDSLIFYDCQTTETSRFQIKTTLNYESIINYRQKIIILTQDCKNIFIFAVQSDVSLIKKFSFDQEIAKIRAAQLSEITILFKQSSLVQKISLWDLNIKTNNVPNCPINQTFLFYEVNGNLGMIQFINQIYFFGIRNKFGIIASIPYLEIVYTSYQQNLCFVGIVNENDQIKKFCFVQSTLTEMFDYPLFDYQIFRPLQYSVFQEKIVIAMLKNNKKFLYIFCVKFNFINSFKELIEVHNFKFSIFDDYLIYYDEHNVLRVKNLGQFFVKIESREICTNIQPQYNYTFQSISFINENEFINTELSLTTIACCSAYVHLKHSNSIIRMTESTQSIKVYNILQGGVSQLQVVTVDQNLPYQIFGPFNFVKYFDQCKYYGELLCQKEMKRYIIIVDDNIERMINLDWSNSQELIFISQIEKNKSLLIATYNISVIYFHFFELINGSFIFQNDNVLNKNIHTPLIKSADKICLISEQFIMWVLLSNTSEIIEQISLQSDAIFIEGSENNYLFSYECQYPCIIILELKKLVDSKFIRVGKTQINHQQIQEELRKINVFLDESNYQKIQFVTSQQIEKILNKVLILFQRSSFSLLCEVVFSNTEIVSFSFSVEKIIRHSQFLQIRFLDPKFLVAYEELNKTYQLFDLRAPVFLVDSMYQSHNQFSIHTYNKTHYIVINDERIGIAFIDYEIRKDDQKPTGENITISIRALNQLSSVEFNLTILESENLLIKKTNGSKNIHSIFLILITFIIIFSLYLLRRQQQLTIVQQYQIARRQNE